MESQRSSGLAWRVPDGQRSKRYEVGALPWTWVMGLVSTMSVMTVGMSQNRMDLSNALYPPGPHVERTVGKRGCGW